jgi:CRISPR system Cascade subunit CasB
MSKVKEKKAEKQAARYYQLHNEEKRDKLLQWWRSLDDVSGARAQLRRCAAPEEAALHRQTYQVMQIVGWASYEAAATIAGVLAHIKPGEHDPSPLGQKLAKPSEPGGSAPFSETRFRQLLKSRDWCEFYRNLRRAVQVLGGQVNPLRVADVILAWDKESKSQEYLASGKSLKFRLSEQYYTNAPKS